MRGLSSIYGFIVTYLLVMSSLQAISSASTSIISLQGSAQRATQLASAQRLEKLAISLSGGNITVTNVGMVPSDLEYILLRSSASTLQLHPGAQLQVGESFSTGAQGAGAAVAVTALGSVFSTPTSSGAPPPGALTGWEGVGGPFTAMQVYQNPSDTSRFLVSEGDAVYALSSSGRTLWRFAAGEGTVTDVLPLPSGYAYVSDGYTNMYAAKLFELDSTGTRVGEYPVRLLQTYAQQEVQYPDLDSIPFPVGSEPVPRGTDSYYASYDGWFFSSSGVSGTSFQSDQFGMLGSDSGHFYVYRVWTDSGRNGCSPPYGNEAEIQSYEADSSGVATSWASYLHFGVCSAYPETMLSASVAGGVVAALFGSNYYSEPNVFTGPSQGLSPYLAVFSTSGNLLYGGYLGGEGYSDIATDGNYVYLALPALAEVERVPVGGGAVQYAGTPSGFSSLLCAYGYVFAISNDTSWVFDGALNLRKTLSFAPSSLYSASNPYPFESALHSPSFLPLNSTSYVALLRNATGFGTLVMGSYR